MTDKAKLKGLRPLSLIHPLTTTPLAALLPVTGAGNRIYRAEEATAPAEAQTLLLLNPAATESTSPAVVLAPRAVPVILPLGLSLDMSLDLSTALSTGTPAADLQSAGLPALGTLPPTGLLHALYGATNPPDKGGQGPGEALSELHQSFSQSPLSGGVLARQHQALSEPLALLALTSEMQQRPYEVAFQTGTDTLNLLDLNQDAFINPRDAQVLYYLTLNPGNLTTLLTKLNVPNPSQDGPTALMNLNLLNPTAAVLALDLNNDGRIDLQDVRVLYYVLRFENILRASPNLREALLSGLTVADDEPGADRDAVYIAMLERVTDLFPVITTGDAAIEVDEGASYALSPSDLSARARNDASVVLSWTVTTAPTNGRLALSGDPGTAITPGMSFTQRQLDAGEVLYVHTGTDDTNDSFAVRLQNPADPEGTMRPPATLTVTVSTPADMPPTAVTLNNVVPPLAEDADVTARTRVADIDVADTDLGPRGLELVGPDAALFELGDDPMTGMPMLFLSADAALDFETNPNLEVTVRAVRNPAAATADLSLALTDVNDAPTTSGDGEFQVVKGASYVLTVDDLAATDVDESDGAAELTWTFMSGGQPTNGRLELSGTPITTGMSFTQAQLEAGQVVYMHDDSNTLSDGFTLQVADDEGLRAADPVIVSIDVTRKFDSIDLSELAIADGFIIQGDMEGDRAGGSVSGIGDVNGDGYADLIVGASSGGDGGRFAGEAYVVFGRAADSGDTTPRFVDLTNLAPDDGFIIRGDMAYESVGRSVSGAGDVNGDGYADLIVGAPGGGDGNAGEAYIVFGKEDDPSDPFGSLMGRRRSIDLERLAPEDGFIIRGDMPDDTAGYSVSAAGDVNGDGFADLIVGARQGFDGGNYAGEAYVVFGKQDDFGDMRGNRRVVDLTELAPAEGFIIQGDMFRDNTGVSVSGAGDVNGDGYADLIVGANEGDDSAINAGEAYVVFGKQDGFGGMRGNRRVVDLTELAPADGFIIRGDALQDRAGVSVSGAGDVNGDGYADLIVGANLADVNTSDGNKEDAGEAYVIFGKRFDFGDGVSNPLSDGSMFVRRVIKLASLAPEDGFIIQGDAGGDQAGRSVSGAGDVNGDGFADFIVGAPGGGDGGGSAGEAYLLFGKEDDPSDPFGSLDGNRRILDLDGLAPEDGFIIQGDTGGDNAGRSVSAAGDVNGDGYADLIVGANGGGDGGNNAGEAYVLFGGPAGLSTEAAAVPGTDGNDLLNGNGQATVVLAGAGDDVLNIDGFGADDLLKFDGGAGTDTLRLSGAGLSLDLSTLADTRLSSIERIDLSGSGANSLRLTRQDLLNLSEVRTNGRAELRVDGNAGDRVNISSDWMEASGTQDTGGTTYNVFDNGNARLLVNIAVAVVADMAMGEVPTTAGDGVFRVVEGRTHTLTPADLSARDPDNDAATLTWMVTTAPTRGHLALSGDPDVAITEFTQRQLEDRGVVYVHIVIDDSDDVFVVRVMDDQGNQADPVTVNVAVASELGSIDLAELTPVDGFIIRGDAAGDQAGGSVSGAGDVNGDGFADLIVGANYGDDGGDPNAGEAYVVFGRASIPPRVVDLTNLGAGDGFIIQGDANGDQAGVSVSGAGDVNGDGFADLIVGAFEGDDGGPNAGEAYVVFGKASGFGSDMGGRRVIDLESLAAGDGFIIQGDANGDRAGVSVAGAGDVNGDGYADLIVGANRGDDGGGSAGEAYVVFGKESDFGEDVSNTLSDGMTMVDRRVINLESLAAGDGFIIQGDANNDRAGESVSGAGDVNGDGYADLIVGALRGDDGGGSAGQAYVVFGKESDFGEDVSNTLSGGTTTVDRRVVDLESLAADDGFIIQGDMDDDRAGSVSGAGDVNGDGYADLIVGALRGDDGGDRAGEAYVVFGKQDGFGEDVSNTLDEDGTTMVVRRVVDLTKLAPADGFIIQGDAPGDNAGVSVSGAGDVNGDGFTDLLVGANQGGDGGFNAGEAYVVFGKASDFGDDVSNTLDDGTMTVRRVVDLTNLAAVDGFIIQGDTDRDFAGTSVSAAGDVNGDGYADLLVGANGVDVTPSDGNTRNNVGEAYVLFGGPAGLSTEVVAVPGTDGDDVLNADGAATVVLAGAGDDVLNIDGFGDTDLLRFDGGSGTDTLRLANPDADTDLDLDLSTLADVRLSSIERIDISGEADNRLTLTRLDLLNLSEVRTEGRAELRVDGNAGDSVTASDGGWVRSADVMIGSTMYRTFDNGNARLLVNMDVSLGGNLMATSMATLAEALQNCCVTQTVNIRALIDALPPEDEEQQRKRLEDELAMLGPLPAAKAAMDLTEPAAVAEPDADLFDLPTLIPDDG